MAELSIVNHFDVDFEYTIKANIRGEFDDESIRFILRIDGEDEVHYTSTLRDAMLLIENYVRTIKIVED